MCLDVCVMRGADCNTDHRLVRAKLVVGRSMRSFKRAHGGSRMKRWDVAKLHGTCVDEKGRVTAKGSFLGSIGEKLRERWDKDSNVEEKLDVLTSVMCDATRECLGHEDRRQPDWFRESEVDLTLFVLRNRLHTLWLSIGREENRKKYADARRAARQAVRPAKDAWFQRKTLEAERGRNGGKLVRRCI